MRWVVPRRIDHRIRFDPSTARAKRRPLSSAATQLGLRSGGGSLPIEHGLLDRRVQCLRGEDLSEVFHEADCVLDCHQDALLHFRSWPGTSLTRAPRGSGSGTGLSLRAWRVFRFRRTAVSRISRARRWRPHDSSTSSRGRGHSHQGQSGFTATPTASRSAAPLHHGFRTNAQIARRLQKARSATDSARQDRSGRKLVARRPLVRGGGPRGHAGARCHCLRLARARC